jgi:hypothetical protein
MRKHSIYIFLLSIAGMTAGLSSCKKYIDKGPINSTYGSEFWTSQTSVEQAALTMYGQFRSCLRASNSYFMTGDLVDGGFSSAAWNLSPLIANTATSFDWPTATADYLEDLTNWTRYYTLIAQCNLILQQVPQMPVADFSNDSTVKNGYIGEALFMRSLAYFFMVRCWGDPVYITRTYDQVDYGNIPPVPRTAEALVLDTCVLDLQKAAGYLSFKGGDPAQTLRANSGSVYALLAHIYAWQHDYKDAHLACTQVIQNGGYSLEPAATYTNIWKGESSLENIMEIAMQFNANDPQFTSTADGYNGYSAWTEAQFSFFSIFLKDSLDDNLTGNGGSGTLIAVKTVMDTLFNVNPATGISSDMRFNTILRHVIASDGDPEGYLLLKYTNFQYQNASLKSNAYVSNNVALFRLADIYLLDAEALAMTGNGGGAVTDLNQTRERAGIGDYAGPMDQISLTNAIFLERQRELIGEGQTFFDMIRTEPVLNKLTEVLGFLPDRVAQKGYYWPLDLGALFSLDPLLTQNPYWANHS